MMHRAAVRARGLMIAAVGGSAPRRGHDAADAQAFAEELMMRFAVVTGVGQQNAERMAAVRLACQGMKGRVVGLGAAFDDRRQRQMTVHVDELRNLGKPAFSLPAALAVVGGAVMRFQAGGVGGGQRMAATIQPPVAVSAADLGVKCRRQAFLESKRWCA